MQEEFDGVHAGSSIKIMTIVSRESAIHLVDDIEALTKSSTDRYASPADVSKHKTLDVDLVVIEVRVLEAFDDLNHIRRIKSYRPMLPIIAISDNTDVELVGEAFKAGVTSFVPSTITPKSFLDHCKVVADMSGSAKMVELQNSELIETLRDLRDANQQLREEIKERKIAENERALAMEQSFSSAKLASLGEMAGSIAHEIKTPLAVVTGSISMLQEMVSGQDKNVDSVKAVLTDIETMMDRIAAIVRGLKAYSRPDEQDPFEYIKVSEIIGDTLSLVQDSVAQSDVSLHVGEIDDDILISCRPTQISQILINLINNAKYEVESKENGSIEIEVARSGGGEVDISVIDNGNGVPKSKLDKVFKAFFTTKPKGVGTGLGLNICQKIAEGHGGKMSLDQSSGRTKFTLTLKESVGLSSAS